MVEVRFRLPEFSSEDAARLAKEHYGIDAIARSLPGERDLNFYLRDASGAEFVLKIANVLEQESVLDLQDMALEHLAVHAPEIQLNRLRRSVVGTSLVRVQSQSGEQHWMRVLSYIPGRLYAEVRPHSAALLRSLGKVLGRIDRALMTFAHPAAGRALKWDLMRAGWIREYVHHVKEPTLRRAVEDHVHRFEALLPAIQELRSSVIYNDANDYNILVNPDRSCLEVIGVIDFGDIVKTRTVCELAVAMAYAALDHPDPLTAVGWVIRGYHEQLPLIEQELGLLFPLFMMRLCVTVANAAYQRSVEPGNEYLTISEKPAREALLRLANIDPEYAHLRFRHACGLSASPHTNDVRSWLSSDACRPAAVLDRNALERSTVLNLGVGSSLIGNMAELGDPEYLEHRVHDRIVRQDAVAGIGRYREARVLAPPDAFRVEGNEGPEWRTIHLGIDVFLDPGSAVFAPLDGVIHSFRDNAARYDYGPTLVLQHTVEGSGISFFTLYGHLSEESIADKEVGQRVRRGQRIGSIGSSRVNGGWPPHLHLQVMTDMLGNAGDFPGNATPALEDFWTQICPDPARIAGFAEGFPASERSDTAQIARRRAESIGPNLSVSYVNPLHIVRGSGAYLFDPEGRAYLDCVNNVAHVGHCHPRVVRAGQDQMEILNTNTRYLHELLVQYAERLCATLPEPLRVCYLVCSGSEANELALRLAKTHTGRRDLIVMEAGYHGNTSGLIDVSSYKFDGPGGKGAPPHVHKVALADPYRGPHRWKDPDCAERYAEDVSRALDLARGAGGAAAFLCESMPGCGGQIVFPRGYLTDAYRRVRDAGGVCIADEVQTGFGRPGSHFWAFETQDVIPDIVTLGKPIGNGHPLGAVITTREIATSFQNGMEYFNTFGGNPVSCVIGMAVLDVIVEEQLQARAQETGSYLMRRLDALAERHSLIGDVRGSGLYIGVELVRDRESLEPAAEEATRIINRSRELGVLLSTDGPLHNVLKIKPPLVFGRSEADRLADTLDRALSEQ